MTKIVRYGNRTYYPFGKNDPQIIPILQIFALIGEIGVICGSALFVTISPYPKCRFSPAQVIPLGHIQVSFAKKVKDYEMYGYRHRL